MTGLVGGVSAVLPFVYAACGAGGLAVILKNYWDNRRLTPKSKAEARNITAAAQDKDWARFQREINRLVKRCETAENKAEEAMAGFVACEEREIALKGRVAELESINQGRSQVAQEAATLMAAERIVERHGRDRAAE